MFLFLFVFWPYLSNLFFFHFLAEAAQYESLYRRTAHRYMAAPSHGGPYSYDGHECYVMRCCGCAAGRVGARRSRSMDSYIPGVAVARRAAQRQSDGADVGY